MLRGTSPALGFLSFHPYNSAAVWGFAVVPMFILMGEIANKGGFIEGLFDFSNKLVGRFTGGLAAAVCLTSAGLAAVTGFECGGHYRYDSHSRTPSQAARS